MPMSLFSEMKEGVLHIHPTDEWDERVQQELSDTVRGQLAVGTRSFLVDLAHTIHIRFRVLGSMKRLYDEVRRAGGELVIASPSFYLLEILAAGDVPRTIPVYPSETSAAMGISHASVASSLVPREGERRGSGLGV